MTGRSKVVVHNWCYHGSVDESFATLDDHGAVVAREGNVGKPVTWTRRRGSWRSTTSTGLERALATGDVAVCMFEPALTNIGIVLPDPGYHEAVRELCHEVRHAAVDRRDAHDQRRPRRLHAAWGLRPRHRHDRQDARRRHPERGVRHDRGAEQPRLRAHRLEERRRRRGRGHAGRQRALDGRDAGDPGRGDDRRRVRADDRARRAVRGGRARRDREPCAPLARRPARMPGRVPVPPRRCPHRERGRGGPGRGARRS